MEQDGRRARGLRSRSAVAGAAAEIASVEGLDGVTMSALAERVGVSKAGVAGLFPDKTALQLAAIDSATATFIDHVVTPALDRPRGTQRLWALVEAWIAYSRGSVFPGGCVLVAAASEYDSKPGPVRDALMVARARWLDLLAAQVEAPTEGGADGPRDSPPSSTPEPQTTAFAVDACLAAANVAYRLGDERAYERARATITIVVGPRSPAHDGGAGQLP